MACKAENIYYLVLHRIVADACSTTKELLKIRGEEEDPLQKLSCNGQPWVCLRTGAA